ncbi:hypothetical protein D3C84_602440 [compost metagenome]
MPLHGASLSESAGGKLCLQAQQTVELPLQTVVFGANTTEQRCRLQLVAQRSALEIGKPLADHASLLLHRTVKSLLLLSQPCLARKPVQPGTHVVDTGLHIFEIRLQLLGGGRAIRFENSRNRGIGADHSSLRGGGGFKYLTVLLETQLVDLFDHRLLPGQSPVGHTRDDQQREHEQPWQHE